MRKVYRYLIHVSREFYFVKLVCRNLYALFSHVRKAYTANQTTVYSCFHMRKYNQSTTAQMILSQSESFTVGIQMVFQIWRLFWGALKTNFSSENSGNEGKTITGLCRVVAPQKSLCSIKKTRAHQAKHRKIVIEKGFGFNERAERVGKY